MTGPRRPLRLLWPAVVALAACSADPALDVRVETDRVAAAPGEVAVRVEVTGGDAADVEFRTTYGQLKDVRVEGDAVLATWYGLIDPVRSPVELQAALGAARGRAIVRIVAGEAAAISVTSPVPWIDADSGRAVLWATLSDAAGMPAVGDVQATVSAGVVAGLIPEAQGRWRIEIEELRSVLDNPIVVSVGDGSSAAVTELTVTAGAPGPYVITVPNHAVSATERFAIELRSVDAWGNPRPAFGEVAGLRAYRQADSSQPIPISPVATNIFVGGAVTMDVSLHGAGPDIVIEAAAPASGPTSRSVPIQVLQVDPQCVVVNPTGLDGRIQEATSLGREGGFPLQVISYAQDCRDIEINGADFSRRLAGLPPEVWAFLDDGTLWGSSLAPDTTPSPSFPGGERVGPVRFRVEDLSWRFEVTGLTDVDFSPVRVTAVVGDIVGQLNVEPTPSRWAGIRIEPIPDQFEGVEVPFGPVTAATGFGFSAVAVDLYGNQVPTAQGTLTCRTAGESFGSSPTRLFPTGTVPPVLGIVNQFVSVLDVSASGDRSVQYVTVRIVCQKSDDPAVTGYSNAFRVWTYDASSFAFDGLSTDLLVKLPGQTVNTSVGVALGVAGTALDQVAGVPFDVNVYARAQGGALITRPLWYGNTMLSALQGTLATAGGTGTGLSKRMTCVDQDGNLFTNPCNNLAADLNQRYSWMGSQQVVIYTAGTQNLIANPPVPSLPPSFRSTAALAALPTTTFTVRPGAASTFVVAAQPPTEATVGAPFGVAVQVVDAWGNNVTDFTGTVEIDDRSRAISPRSLPISGGRAEGNLTIWTAIGPDQLTFTLPALGKRRTSDVFLVVEP